MDYGRPDRAERLAAEYTLGTLRGAARRRFERLLPAHPALAAAVAAWLARLQLLAAPVQPVEPPARLWAALQARLFGAANAPAMATPGSGADPWQRRTRRWRGLSAAALAAAVLLAVLALRPSPPAAPIVVVLQSTPQGAALLDTGFVASVSADGRALVLRPLKPVAVDVRQALQLWAVPRQGTPRSLGLVQAGTAPTTVMHADLLRGTQAFAVSLEPAGGSRTGQPTGPIVSAGEL